MERMHYGGMLAMVHGLTARVPAKVANESPVRSTTAADGRDKEQE